jgi:hypothetical protein
MTLAISYLNNRFQAKERDKDRDENRRAAKIQAREKWIERDILKIIDLIEQTLTVVSEVHNFNARVGLLDSRKRSRQMSTDEFNKEFKSFLDRVPDLLFEGDRTFAKIEELVYSFPDPEIISSYKDFESARKIYWKQVSDNLVYRIENLGSKLTNKIDTHDSRDKLTQSAGRFHQTLREKLVSLRDL